MRWLLVLITAAAVLWGGYWFVGARAVERAAGDWFAESGGLARADGVSVAGFPNRFDLTVTAPELYDPYSGIGWQAPFFQIFSLSYKPHHLIAVWPTQHWIVTPRELVEVTSASTRASMVLKPGRALEVDRLALAAEELAAESAPMALGLAEPWQMTVAGLRLASRQVVGQPERHDIGLEVTGLRAGPGMAEDSGLPAEMKRLLIEARVTLDRPATLTDAVPPRPEAIDVRNIFARWGEAELRGEGDLTVEPDGTLAGRIELRADNWRQILSLAVALGMIRPEVEPTWETGLRMLAEQEEPATRISLPLVFNRGVVSLGPLPLGAGPRLPGG